MFRWVKRVGSKRLVFTVVVLGAFLWGLSLWVPYFARHTLEQEVKRFTGRSFEFGEVHFNPLTMRLVVDHLTVFEPNGHDKFVSLGQLVMGVSWSSLWHGSPVVREVLLGQPTVYIVRLSDQRYNFSDLLDLMNSSKSPGSGVVYKVRSIQVTAGAIHYHDNVLHEQHDMTQLECVVPGFSNATEAEDTPVQSFLTARIDGTPLELNGKAYPFEKSRPAILHVQIPRLELPELLAKFSIQAPLHLDSGTLGMNATMQWDNGILKVSGTVNLDHVRGSLNQQAFETTQMKGQLTDFEYQVTTKIKRIGHLKLNLNDFRWNQKSGLKLAPEDFVKSEAVAFETSLEWEGSHLNLVGGSLHLKQLNGVVQGQQFAQSGSEIRINSLKYDWANHSGKMVRFALDLPDGEWSDESLQLRLKQGKIQWGDLHWNSLNNNVSLKDFQWASGQLEGQEKHAHVHFGGQGLEGDLSRWNLVNGFRGGGHSDGKIVIGATHWHINQGFFQDRESSKKNDFIVERGDGQLSELVLKPSSWPLSGGRFANLHLSHIVLALQNVTVIDGALKHPLQTRLTQVKMDISPSRGSQTRLNFFLKGIFDQKSPISVQGVYDSRTHEAQVKADLKHVELAPFQAYFLRPYGLRMHRGAVSLLVNGRVWQESTGLWQEQLSGQAQLNNWDVWSLDERHLFAKWKALFFGSVMVDTSVRSIQVGEVSLNDYKMAGVLESSGQLNWVHLFSAPHKTVSPVQANPWQFTVTKISLEQGTVNFYDHYIKPNYHVRIVQLGGVISNLSSAPKELADIDLRGQIGDAPFQMTGNIRPLSTQLFLNLDAHARGLDLVSFSPLIGQYVGYQITEGKLSADVSYHVENGQLVAKNHIILDQLELGSPTRARTLEDLPVVMAVDLLKNRHGVIDVHLPVQGSLEDPEFSVRNVVTRLFEQVIKQAVDEPFSLLADFFDHGSKPSWMAFMPGSYVLSSGNITQLRQLSEALRVHSHLRLSIEGQAGGNGDEDGVKHSKLDRQVAFWLRQHPGQNQNQALQALYQSSSIPKPKNIVGLDVSLTPAETTKLLLTNESVSNKDYDQLAYERARSVQDWLIESGGIDNTRVFLEEGVPPPKQNLEGGLARVDFRIN